MDATHLFADVALAARIEAAEAALVAMLVRALDPAEATVAVDELGGGLAVLARPGSPSNKVVGVGFSGPLEDDALDLVEARWWARGETVRFEVSTLADRAILHQLTERGYRLDGFEHVLARRLTAADADADAAPGVSVERVTGSTDEWLDVSLDGWSHGDGTGAAEALPVREALRPIFRDFTRADMPRYLARVDGAPAGSAAARYADGLAQLCGASTAPAARRRGVQRALLAARLADAVAASCELALVTTGPGTQSQANVMRLGFELVYARAVLLRPPPEAS